MTFSTPQNRNLKSLTNGAKRLCAAWLFMAMGIGATAQVVQTFNSSGTFTAPAGVTRVVVDCYGGGGRGATRTTNGQGGGGGGGAFASSVITVVPGTNYTVTVGAGSTSAATPGGDSWFISALTVMAKGGSSVANNVATGGTGGAAAASVGTKRFSGGDGGTGSTAGGGGGSSAGYGGAGVAGSAGGGGTAPAGGGNGGGAPLLFTGNGSSGSAPGGGGGGGVRLLSGTGNGGSGGTGRVVVSYYDGTCMTGATGINAITDNSCASGAYTRVPVVISGLPTTMGTNQGDARLTNVQLVVSHPFNSDMQITLTSPAGATRNLILNKFGTGDNLGNPANCPNAVLTLQDGSPALPTANTSNSVGTFAPEQTLAGFSGDPNGMWLLNACDNAAQDVGVIRYVRLNFCAPPVVSYTPVDNCGSNQFNAQLNVTSLGSGTIANLVYTINGGSPITLNNIGLGVTTIGPFPVGAEIACTVSNGTICGNSTGVVYSNCPILIPCGTTVAMNHCYRNNDARTFTFTSSSAFETVTLSFVGGTMHANDVIRAYSGTDNNGTPIPSLTGSFANLTGVSGTSSGSTLFLEIDSDGSNSCSTGQQTSWSIEAECTPGCVDPDGSVTVNTNCGAYNFTLDVEVLFVGDASSSTLRYTVNGGAPTDLPGLIDFDLVTIGPFAIDDIVNVRLLHENNASCDRNLGNFTDNNSCPGGENCLNALNLGTQTSPLPGTTVGRTNDFNMACGTATANTAPDAIYYIDIPNGAELNIRQQSNNYDSQHYLRYGGTCPGTTVIACIDDEDGETGWITWANTTGSTKRVWWVQDGFSNASGTFTLQWSVTTCPVAPGPPTLVTSNYTICQNGIVPSLNGIAASCASVAQSSTYVFPGGGLISEGTTLTTRSTLVAPALPAGAVVTGARLKLTGVVANTSLVSNAQRQNIRVALSGAYTLAETQLTTATGPGTVSPDPVINLIGYPVGGGTINFRTRQTSDQFWTSPDVNIASAVIEVDYTVPTTVRWYNAPVSGTLLSSGPLFDPVGTGAVNSAVPGTTQFYATCGFASCENIRLPASFTVVPLANAGTNGTLTICDNATTTNLLLHLGGSPQGGGAWSGPSPVVGGMYNPATMAPGNYTYTVTGTTPCANASAIVVVTETPPTPWYADLDNDLSGDPGSMVMACAQPPGYVANSTDLCPGDPLKQTPGTCGCNVADADTDGDALADCVDPCPLLTGVQNGDICDANPGTGYTLGTITACACQPVACNNGLNLEFQTDGTSDIGWELRQQGTNTLVQSGGGIYPPSPAYAENTCLPDGCFYLRVTDAGGDGITGGGYVLRGLGKRIIDNRNNFTSGGVSAIANNEGFCLPAGNDRLIYVSCDRLDWTSNEYIVANDNPAVTAQWGVGNQTDDGYEMWFFNPNGGYSFRKFHSHAVSDGFAPANGVRACHIKVNNWTASNHLQNNVLYNVRVRSRVNGVNTEWGAACRFTMDAVRAQCPLTKLMDIPGNQYLACGGTRSLGASNLIHARPVTRVNSNGVTVSANKYQFRFRIPAESISITKTSQTGQYWVPATGPLQACKTYEVDVRASFDNGATWCTDFVAPALTNTWGDVCLLTIGCSIQGGGQNMAVEGGSNEAAARFTMYPNPNRGDQLQVNLEGIAKDVTTVAMEIHDSFGKRVSARTITVGSFQESTGGMINTTIDLNGELAAGMYVVSITAGDKNFVERLVIQP